MISFRSVDRFEMTSVINLGIQQRHPQIAYPYSEGAHQITKLLLSVNLVRDMEYLKLKQTGELFIKINIIADTGVIPLRGLYDIPA